MSKKMGRPIKEIDSTEFEKLCALQCTEVEIAGWFSVSVDTIERWCKREYKMTFAEIYRQKRQKGAISLRRLQWQSAEKGNVVMQIFLGKQYLGQSDKMEIDHDNEIKFTLPEFLTPDEKE